jgi:hypothetical protein
MADAVRERERETFQEGITQKVHSIKIESEFHQLHSRESRSYFNVVTIRQDNCACITRFERTDRQVEFYIYGQFSNTCISYEKTGFDQNNFHSIHVH